MKLTQYRAFKSPLDDRKVVRFKEWTTEIPDVAFDNPDLIYELMTKTPNLQIDKNTVEYLYMLCLDKNYHAMGLYEVSKGTIDSHLISNRDIIMNAVLTNSYRIVLIHNHPSGNPRPSESDIENTEQLAKALKICDMCLVDHIVIGKDSYFSIGQNTMYPQK